MNFQNEGNHLTQKRGTILHLIEASLIDKRTLPEVIVQLGKRNLQELLNAKLNNHRFEVKFDFDNVKRTLIGGEFADLSLYQHDFTIPKPTRILATTEAIQDVFDSDQVTEDDTTITFKVYLGEGPYANTVGETVYNINRVLGPVVEANAKKLGLNDYHMTFNISLAY